MFSCTEHVLNFKKTELSDCKAPILSINAELLPIFKKVSKSLFI
jgi:hypothetical protein